MADHPQRYDFDRVFRLVLTTGTILGGLWLLNYLSGVILPFAVAVLLAYLLNPVVNAFEQRLGGRRGMAVAVTVTVFSLFLLVLIPFLGALVWGEFNEACAVIANPETKHRIVTALEPLIERSGSLRTWLDEFIEKTDSAQLQQMAANAFKMVFPQVKSLTVGVANLLGSMIQAVFALTVLIIIFIYMIFLMMDFNEFQAHWQGQLPPRYRDGIVAFLGEFSTAMGRYFRGQFLVALCCGVLFAAGFMIVGLRMAVLLGLFIGLLNMVPYLQTIGLVPALLLGLLRAYETSASPVGLVVAVLLVFGVVQLIQEAVLVPRIMGRTTGLKPWVILLGIFVWGKLLGFLGLVLAIPLSCLGLAYYRRFILGHPTAATRE